MLENLPQLLITESTADWFNGADQSGWMSLFVKRPDAVAKGAPQPG